MTASQPYLFVGVNTRGVCLKDDSSPLVSELETTIISTEAIGKVNHVTGVAVPDSRILAICSRPSKR